MKLSKEQKDQAIGELSLPWGRVHLMCDGYRITLSVERYKGMSYRIMTYVNGVFEGKWCSSKGEYPEQKFMRKSVRPLCSAQKKARDEKLFGKRIVSKDPWYTKKLTIYLPDWASGKAAINHLCKVCDSVQIAEPQESATQEAP